MKVAIKIDSPCSEDWNKMLPNATGKFCGSCQQTVQDLTQLTATELQNFIRDNWQKKVCGRISVNQSETVMVDVTARTFFKPRTVSHRFLLAVFLVFGTTLVHATTVNNRQADFQITSIFQAIEDLSQDTTKKKVSDKTIEKMPIREVTVIAGGLSFYEVKEDINTDTLACEPDKPSYLSKNDQLKLSVYPNPTSAILHVDLSVLQVLENPKIIITKMSGVLVHTIEPHLHAGEMGQRYDVDVANWEKTWYIVNIYSNNQLRVTSKVLVK